MQVSRGASKGLSWCSWHSTSPRPYQQLSLHITSHLSIEEEGQTKKAIKETRVFVAVVVVVSLLTAIVRFVV